MAWSRPSLDIDSFDETHTYCITQRLPGTTVEDLPPADAADVVGAIAAAWAALASCDVRSVAGFGDFDAEGHAPASTRRAVLLGILEAATDANVTSPTTASASSATP